MDEFLSRIANLSRNRLELLTSELQQRVTELECARQEPIAIIGTACRMPGEVGTPDEFWQLLVSGRDAIQRIPSGRWELVGWTDPGPGSPATEGARWGGFLKNIDLFDPA